MNTGWIAQGVMQVGMRYIVTRASEDLEFQVGDHIRLCADGSIECREASGWMDASDVPAAIRGMTVAVDSEWLAKRRAELEAQLAELHAVGVAAKTVEVGA